MCFLFFPPIRGKTSGFLPRQVFSGWHKKVVFASDRISATFFRSVLTSRVLPPLTWDWTSLRCVVLFHQYSHTQVLPEATFSGPSKGFSITYYNPERRAIRCRNTVICWLQSPLSDACQASASESLFKVLVFEPL